MCITFFITNQASEEVGKYYKLVIFFNRDEYFERPTAPADWQTTEDECRNIKVLCGRDLTEGREGGTWLGADDRGRVAMLTNVFTGTSPKPGAAGRGFLVIDYLQGQMDAGAYLDSISQSPKPYSPFNLVLFEPSFNSEGAAIESYSAHYYCRGDGDRIPSVSPTRLPPGKAHGVGNHPIHTPYQKTKDGVGKFQELMATESSGTDELIKGGFELMRCGKSHPSCPQIRAQRHPDSDLPDSRLTQLSSIFVDIGSQYGTRMQTAVVVDSEDRVTFVERTRQKSLHEEVWDPVKKFHFDIERLKSDISQ